MRICRFKVWYARLNDYYYVVERVKIKSKMDSFISFLEYYANWYGYVWLSIWKRLQWLRWHLNATTKTTTNLWKDRSFTRWDTTTRGRDHRREYWIHTWGMGIEVCSEIQRDTYKWSMTHKVSSKAYLIS